MTRMTRQGLIFSVMAMVFGAGPIHAAEGVRIGYQHLGVTVEGDIVTTSVHQVLINDLDSPVEAVFRYPLPDDASVTAFGEWRGGRFFPAQLTGQAEAEARYEAASAEGRPAVLGAAPRSNDFTIKLFGLEARGVRRIRLTYTQTLYGLAGERTLVVPRSRRGEVPPTIAEVSVAIRDTRSIHTVKAPGHPGARIWTSERSAIADFSDIGRSGHAMPVIHWQRVLSPLDLDLATHAEHVDEASFFLARFAFDRDPIPSAAPPRTIVVLLDRSMSMAGAPLATARHIVRRVVDGLTPRDEVNFIPFNSRGHALYPNPRQADKATIDDIHEALEAVQASGRSNLNDALKSAAQQLVHSSDGVLLLLTDGQPTYRRDGADPFSFDADIAALGSARVVLAQFNYPRRLDLLRAMLPNLSVRFVPDGPPGVPIVDQIEALTIAPTITDLSVEFDGPQPEMVHGDLPNRLAVGASLRLAGRFHESTRIRISGRLHGMPIEVEHALPLPLMSAGAGTRPVAMEWARLRVAALESQRRHQHDQRRRESLDSEIKYVGERFGLATSQTSFVLADSLSPDRIKPGDPELRIHAPRGANRVFGILPWGASVECSWDDEEGVWLGRFLAPRHTPDGLYRVRVFVEIQGHSRYRGALFFRVDSTLPPFELKLAHPGEARAGQMVTVVARPAVPTQPDSPDEVRPEPIDVKRVVVQSGLMSVELRREDGVGWVGEIPLQSTIGPQRINMVATDFARNSRHATLIVEVRP
ncbi:MAG: VIT domain-containing protein [Myxococcota bacterium]|nr:VIT domain-containing protein [Myxococcota bacterium]